MKIIVGGKGRMGQLIAKTAEEHGHTVIGLFDAFSLDELKTTADKADMIIDFSHRDNLGWICDYVSDNNAALVYGTTGLSPEQKEQKDIYIQRLEEMKQDPGRFQVRDRSGCLWWEDIYRAAGTNKE